MRPNAASKPSTFIVVTASLSPTFPPHISPDPLIFDPRRGKSLMLIEAFPVIGIGLFLVIRLEKTIQGRSKGRLDEQNDPAR